jgi:protein phosphatase
MNLEQVLQIVSETDVGMVRSRNEDSVAIDGSRGLVILADGMGGHNAGEVASGMAIAVIMTEMRNALDQHVHFKVDPLTGQSEAQKLLRDHIGKANTAIYQTSQSQPHYAGMGTTLVVALFHDNKITVAHIGDSRLYRLRGEELEQMTKDHSLLQEQIDGGLITPEQVRESAHKNIVLRALGVDTAVESEIHDHATLPSDIYLLCSDGLSDMVSDEDIGLALRTHGTNLKLCSQRLVQMANDNGGRDNVSIILVKVLHDYAVPRGFLAKALGWLRRTSVVS